MHIYASFLMQNITTFRVYLLQTMYKMMHSKRALGLDSLQILLLFGLDSLQKFPHFGLDSLQNIYLCTKKIRATPLFMKDKIDYIVMLISEFAKRNNITQRQAYSYISRFKGFELCDRHYGIMHTLSLDDNVNSLSLYCRKNGGTI